MDAPIEFAKLSADDQSRALQELRRAAVAIERPDLVARLSHKLAMGPGGVFLGVQFPRHKKHYNELSALDRERLTIDANRHAHWPSREEDDDSRWLESDREFQPLTAALSLLSSPDSPEAELDRRREIVDGRRAAERQRADTIAEAQRKQEAARAEWKAKNGRREARFHAIPRELQLAYAAADRLPPFIQSIVVLFLIEYARASQEFTGRRTPPLPVSFPAIPEDERERTYDGRLIER